MKDIILKKEFDPALRAMLAGNVELSHEISKVIKTIPVELFNKITKLNSLNNKAIHYHDDKYIYDINVVVMNNKLQELNMFKEEIGNSKNYCALRLRALEENKLEKLHNESVLIGTFSKNFKEGNSYTDEITYKYRVKRYVEKSGISYAVYTDYDLDLYEQNKIKNLEQRHPVQLDELFNKEVTQER